MAREIPHTEAPYPDHVNRHLLTVEDDIVFIRFIGEYAPSEARVVLALLDRVYGERGRVFFLGDVSQGVAPGPDTRRAIADWPYQGDSMTAAYFGANWTLRAGAMLIHSAMRLVLRKPSPSYYAKTEAEARAWLAEQRQAQATKA